MLAVALLCAFCGFARAQGSFAQPTDAAGEAALTDPVQECTPYYNVAPFSSMVSLFPTVWHEASILPQDTSAQALYNSISAGIPNIEPRGSPLYDPSPWFANYSRSDPNCWWTYSQCTTPKNLGLPTDISQCSQPNTLGLAFDDGPNCTHNAFYNFLSDNHLKANMFFIGSNLLDHPLQGQAALNDGHVVCAHTWSHKAMVALNNTAAFAELYYSVLAIKNILGVTPRCWRPPYGDVDDRIRYIANALGLQTIVWTENTNDYYVATLGPDVINKNYQEIIQLQQSGAFGQGVALEAHELNNATMQLFANNYDGLAGAFPHMEPIHACNNITQPYFEQEYVYPNHAQFIAGTSMISTYTATASPVSSLTGIVPFVSVSGLPAPTMSISGYLPPSVTSTASLIGQPTATVGGTPDPSLIVNPSTQPAGAAVNAAASATQGAAKSAGEKINGSMMLDVAAAVALLALAL